MAHQTVLLFDWDDTLCASTYCRAELPDQLVCKVWQDCFVAPKKREEEYQAKKKAKAERKAARRAARAAGGSANANDANANNGAADTSSSKVDVDAGGQVAAMPGTYVEAWNKDAQGENKAKAINDDGGTNGATNGAEGPDSDSEGELEPLPPLRPSIGRFRFARVCMSGFGFGLSDEHATATEFPQTVR